MRNRILVGDAIEMLRQIPDGSVQCIISSPPYYGLRSYLDAEHEDKGKEIGAEKTPKQFIDNLVAVFREAKRVLRDDGTLWVNIGDSYSIQHYGRRDHGTGNLTSKLGPKRDGIPCGTEIKANGNRLIPGLKPKDLIGIPWMLAFALRDDGWWLRQELIWAKGLSGEATSGNVMPESVEDRCTKAHEQIFLFTKSDRYFFDHIAIQEDAVTGWNGSEFHTGKTADHQLGRASKQPRFGGTKYGDNDDPHHATKIGNEYAPNGKRNRRSVWHICTSPSDWEYCSGCGLLYEGIERGKIKNMMVGDAKKKVCARCGATDKWISHFASFPADLIRPMIFAGTSAYGACAACGAPWRRKTKTDTEYKGGSGAAGRTAEEVNGSGKWAGKQYGKNIKLGPVTTTTTTGWEPSCECGAEDVVPCIVLDPFMGSGTTAIVAASEGRDYLGCDLNSEYAAIAEARIARSARQVTLFDMGAER